MTEPNLDKSIDDLRTSVRLANILANAVDRPPDFVAKRGLPPPHTLRALTQWRASDLMRLPNLGKRMLDEVNTLLSQEGGALRAETDPHCPSVSRGAMSATQSLVDILDPLPPNLQIRAIRAACTILGHDIVFPNDR